MAAKKKKKVRPIRRSAVSAATSVELRKSLMRCKKAELVDLLVQLADEHKEMMRSIIQSAGTELDVDSLVAMTQTAIADATAYDERQINNDFNFDWAAYETIEENFRKLRTGGQFKPLMKLAMDLMSKGSEQLEMSDEGMMFDSIQDCLMVVIEALPQSGVSPAEIKRWSKKMLAADRIGSVCDQELEELAGLCL